MGNQAGVPEKVPDDTCPLAPRDQTRNLLLYGINTSLIYLASPVLYVGTVHGPLCKELGADDKVANLPGTVYFAGAAVPILVAWYFPFVAVLKRLIVAGFAIIAAMLAVVAVVLIAPVANWVKITVIVLQGLVAGGTVLTSVACMWEVLGRGVSPSRRGLTLSIAFGIGPIFAVLASLTTQMLRTGKIGPFQLGGLVFPWEFVTLFAGSVPIMVAAALLSTQFVIPQPAQEVSRKCFREGVFGGLGEFLANRTLRIAAVVTLLMYAGSLVNTNMTLYTKAALGEAAADYAGYQLALRFSFKCVTGLFLGWLLAKTNPRAGLLLTIIFAFLAVAWILLVPGIWFLVAFGIFGAGELIGVYAPNYILSGSSPGRMRRNMGFATMLLALAAPAGFLFGAISDYFTGVFSERLGFQLSFVAALLMIGFALFLALWLPARPAVEAEGEEKPAASAS
jgi:MFS family permease